MDVPAATTGYIPPILALFADTLNHYLRAMDSLGELGREVEAWGCVHGVGILGSIDKTSGGEQYRSVRSWRVGQLPRSVALP